ncbi:MAG: uroporphyrinogen decarboxylase family protein, partial [Candidatus Latescibacteria bacterium]|nr:uroporphyrinogen decarboxylase family protein [Candidatus Latescibacterota bacterium]
MTSKERIIATLNGQEPDRVPVGEFAVDHEAVEGMLGRPTFWRGHFKTTKALWEGRRDEVVWSMIEDLIEFHHKVPLDMIAVSLVPPAGAEIKPYEEIAPGTYKSDEGDVYKVGESQWLLRVEYAEREYTLDSFPEPGEYVEPDESCWELWRAVVKEFGDTHFILARSGDATFPMLGGMENAMHMMVDSPEILQRAAETGTTTNIAMDAMFVREGADGLCPATDYATSKGPLCSPKWIEEMFLPSMKRQTDATHEIGSYALKHACGNNWALGSSAAPWKSKLRTTAPSGTGTTSSASSRELAGFCS